MRIDNRAIGNSMAVPIAQIEFGETAAVGAEKLRQLYITMSKLRSIRNQESTRVQTNHDITFNEACEVGCTIDLQREDLVVPLPHQIATASRATRESEFEPPVNNTFCIDTAAKSWNILAAQPSASRLSLATGAAFAHKMRRGNAVVVAFCAGAEIERSKDALYFAMDHGLPIIYVHLPNAKPSKNGRLNNSQLDPTFIAIPVDRSDVVAVYRVASEAIDRARRGVGPTLIQCIDWPLSPRKRQLHNSRCRDPIAYMESYLRSKSLWSSELEHYL